MTPTAAAQLLDLPADATPDQLEARFHELRAKLEDKIAKAPTPGLKAKYRESLDQITLAFETLTLAADSSSLPVLQKQRTDDGGPRTAGGTATPPRDSDSGLPATASAGRPVLGGEHSATGKSQVSGLAPAKRAKSGGKEFLIVAVIAIAVLGAGGWFIMKTRAENAEKARIAIEAKLAAERQAAAEKAEQERLANVARLEAEEKKRTEEAERVRQEKLSAQLRGDLAEAKVIWEAIEREERTMDRKLGELKSDLRNLKDAAPGRVAEARAAVAVHQRYYGWLSETLVRHPAKVARGKAEELLGARQVDEAATAVAALKSALADLDRQVATERKRALDLDGELVLATDANVTWQIEDAFGQVRTGTGAAELDGLAVGLAKVRLRKPSWPDRALTVAISTERPAKLDASYASHMLELTSDPEGAEVTGADGANLGVTPFSVAQLPPGKLTLTVSKEGYYPETVELTLPATGNTARPIALRVKPKGFERPSSWNGPAKVRVETRTSSESTGSFVSNSSSQFVEEWDFSERDSKVGWRRAVRRWVSLSGSNREYMPVDGSAVRLSRQPDGSWAGDFIQGGLNNPEHNRIWASAPTSFWLVTFGLQDLFPSSPVEIGGTWEVKSEIFFPTIGLKNAVGKVQGRLVGLDREGSAEWADLEYSYTYTMATISSQGVMKLRANLSDGYVSRMEGRDGSTAGEMKIRASYSSTITTR